MVISEVDIGDRPIAARVQQWGLRDGYAAPTLDVTSRVLTTTKNTAVQADGNAAKADAIATIVAPEHGVVSASIAGGHAVIIYTPTQDYVGPDSFALAATKGAAMSDTVAFTVSVNTGENTAPTLQAYTPDITCTIEDAVALTFTATDVDYPPQALTFSATGGSCPHALDFSDGNLSGGCPLTGVACTIEFQVSDGVVATSGVLNVPATARFVAKDATGTGDGSSWANAYAGLANVPAGELPVVVKNDTYTGSGGVIVQTSARYYGGFAGTEASLQQRGSTDFTTLTGTSGPLVQITAGEATFERFALQDVPTNRAISCSGATLAISHSRLVRNSGSSGGALLANDCDVTLRDSIFDANNALSAGALSIGGSNGSLTIDNVVFSNNSALQTSSSMALGGAIYSAVPKVTINHAMFYGNTAGGLTSTVVGVRGGDASGGALYLSNATSFSMTGSHFEENSANGGAGSSGAVPLPAPSAGPGGAGSGGGTATAGAIFISGLSTWTIERTIFRNNVSVGGDGGHGGTGAMSTTAGGNGGFGGSGGAGGYSQGGAIFALIPSLTATSVTFIGNRAISGAGGDGGAGGAGGPGDSNGATGGPGGLAGVAQYGTVYHANGSLTCLHCSVVDNQSLAGNGGAGGAGGPGNGLGSNGAAGIVGGAGTAERSGLTKGGGQLTVASSAFYGNLDNGVTPSDITYLSGTTVTISGVCAQQASLGSGPVLTSTPFTTLPGGEELIAATSPCADAGDASLEGDYAWTAAFNRDDFSLDTGAPDAGAHYSADTVIRSITYAAPMLTVHATKVDDCELYAPSVGTITKLEGSAPFPAATIGFARCGDSFVVVDSN